VRLAPSAAARLFHSIRLKRNSRQGKEMYRILYISRFNQESLHIKNVLGLFSQFEVDWVRNPLQATQSLAKQQPDMVIINVDHFNEQKKTIAQQMRKMGYSFPILYMANSGARIFAKSVRRLGLISILEKPCSEKDLLGVIEKLRQGKLVTQRAYRRYETKQNADIEFWNTGRKIPGHILNLSLGGAELKVKDSTLKVGDVLKLNVELKELAKKHELNAKVVWATEYDPLTQTNQIGVQFVKTVEIYQNLLNRI
jgi:DNA-binding response OmpR family regulator